MSATTSSVCSHMMVQTIEPYASVFQLKFNVLHEIHAQNHET